jgi:dUTP pyrophosphatase
MYFCKLSPSALEPKRATEGSIGYDLSSDEVRVVMPNSRALISTGISVALPEGCYGRIAPDLVLL